MQVKKCRTPLTMYYNTFNINVDGNGKWQWNKNPYVYNHIISTIRHRTEHGFKRNKHRIIEHMENLFFHSSFVILLFTSIYMLQQKVSIQIE